MITSVHSSTDGVQGYRILSTQTMRFCCLVDIFKINRVKKKKRKSDKGKGNTFDEYVSLKSEKP